MDDLAKIEYLLGLNQRYVYVVLLYEYKVTFSKLGTERCNDTCKLHLHTRKKRMEDRTMTDWDVTGTQSLV